MNHELIEIGPARVLVYRGEHGALRTDRDATRVIASAFEQRAECVVLPLEALDPEFLDLASRIAGEILQKFVQYRIAVFVMGDFQAAMSRSQPLSDFIYETNRGTTIAFVPSLDEVRQRIETRQGC